MVTLTHTDLAIKKTTTKNTHKKPTTEQKETLCNAKENGQPMWLLPELILCAQLRDQKPFLSKTSLGLYNLSFCVFPLRPVP
jgi:hypothetical protein